MPALPRGWLGDTVALYRRVFRRGATLALRNWPVGLVVIVYGVLLRIATLIAAPLGIVGGFLVYLAFVACASSWLSLVAQVLRAAVARTSPSRPSSWRHSRSCRSCSASPSSSS